MYKENCSRLYWPCNISNIEIDYEPLRNQICQVEDNEAYKLNSRHNPNVWSKDFFCTLNNTEALERILLLKFYVCDDEHNLEKPLSPYRIFIGVIGLLFFIFGVIGNLFTLISIPLAKWNKR